MEDQRRGRPPGTHLYPVKKLLRMGEEHAAGMRELAARWQCTEAEALRRAILETVRRERRKGVE